MIRIYFDGIVWVPAKTYGKYSSIRIIHRGQSRNVNARLGGFFIRPDDKYVELDWERS